MYPLLMPRPMDILADTPYMWPPISMTSYDGETLQHPSIPSLAFQKNKKGTLGTVWVYFCVQCKPQEYIH